MPKITKDTVIQKSEDGICGPVDMLRFSDTGGLTQFGAFVEILPPGSTSAPKHWHSDEDEMIYLLDGALILYEGETRTELLEGDAATFKAGTAVGHYFANESDEVARYLVIGTRARSDRVTYPDHGRVLVRDRDAGTVNWEDLSGAPADCPFPD